MKRLTIGMLAHVDSGKTTLSEAMLYRAGAVRRLGRVDHGDAFLDTEEQERERSATFSWGRPCWRLPKKSPGPRRRRSSSAIWKTPSWWGRTSGRGCTALSASR